MTKIIDSKEYFTDDDFVLNEDELEDENKDEDDSELSDEINENNSRPLLYFASPKQLYNSDIYNQLLGRVYSNFSYCDIHDAKNEWGSSEVWLSNWLVFSDLIDILIFASDQNGLIGKGVFTELVTAPAQCKILYLTPNGEFIPYECITLQLFNEGQCWSHYKRVIIITDTKE